MCIAIIKCKGEQLSYEAAETSFENNSHGAGFCYIENGKVLIKKGYYSFEDFWEAFEPIQAENDDAMLIHFRIATSGNMDEENCHPWPIDENHALIHNGIISSFSSSISDLSDTGLFTNIVMKKIFSYGKDKYKAPYMKWLIEEAIGSYNKIAVLSSDGTFTIYNEKQWYFVNGIWFSNHSFINTKTHFSSSVSNFHSTNNNNNNNSSNNQNDEYDDYSPTPRSIKKKYRVRKVGETTELKCREIAALLNEQHTSISSLVDAGVVERIYEDVKVEDTEEGPNPMSEDYKLWWMRTSGHMAFDSNTFESEGYSG